MAAAPQDRTSACKSRCVGGFTLAELLVAVSVLLMLVVFAGQLLTRATSVTSTGTKRMDANAEAQFVFDRMAADFGNIVKRADVDYYLQKNTGSDQLAFFSGTAGYYPTGVSGVTAPSAISLVGYRIQNNRLERLSKGLIWNGVTSDTTGVGTLPDDAAPMVFSPQTIVGTWPAVEASGSDSDYEIMSSAVYRFEYRYLLKNGTISDTPYIAPHTSVSGMQDVAALVVAIALLDAKSRVIVPDMGSAAAKLADPTGTDVPLKPWNDQLHSGDLGLPQVAASQVRFYQRVFYLSSAP